MPKTTKTSKILLDKMSSQQKEFFFAYVNSFLQQKSNEKFYKGLSSNDKIGLASTITVISFVSERLLQKARSETEFQYILGLFHKSKDSKKIHPELQKIFKVKKEEVLHKLETNLEELRSKILGKQYKNYSNLSLSVKENRTLIRKKILEEAIANCNDSNLIQKYRRVIGNIMILKGDLYFKLSPAILEMKSDGRDLIESFTFLVYKPEEYLLPEFVADKENWERFPLKWAGNLPINEIKTLFDMFKDGEDISPYFVTRYKQDGTKVITLLLDDPMAKTSISPNVYFGMKEAINQALSCYKKRHYMAFMYAIFPIIEGILWEFSSYLEAIGEINIYVKGTDNNKIINISGKTSDSTIGNLLNNTNFQNYFDRDFIQYFCGELYNERNPILHGKDFKFASIENASKKLATLEYLFTLTASFVREKIIQELNKVASPKVVNDLLKATKRNKTEKKP